MIASADRLLLAPGVVLEDGHLADEVRGERWPLNAAGTFVLTRSGSRVGQIVDELGAAFGLSEAQARADVLQFTWLLNGLALVNLERRDRRFGRLVEWIALAARLAPSGAWPAAVASRRAVDTTTTFRSLATSLAAVWSRAAVVALAAALVVAQFVAVIGAAAAAYPLAVGLGTGIGIGVHEAAHVIALRGVPSAIVLHGRRLFVLHARVESNRRLTVALAGPVGAVAAGLGFAALGVVAGAPQLALVGVPMVAHALALTVACGDGRVACGL